MRLMTVCAFLFLSGVAQAYALDAATWQSLLQDDVNKAQKSTPYLHAKGEVMAEEVDGNQTRALLPAFVMQASDQSRWEIPAIALQTTVSAKGIAPVDVLLPQKFSHVNNAGQPLGSLTLKSQQWQGNWNFQENAFEKLSGTLGNVIFMDMPSNATSAASKITINADNAGTVNLGISQIGGGNTKALVKAQDAAISYQFGNHKRLDITRIISLLNPAMLLAENQKLGIDLNANNVQFILANGKTTSFEKLVSHLQIQPVTAGQTVSVRSEVSVANVLHTPQNAFAAFLPQTANMLGTISDAPLELLAYAPGQDFSVAQVAMVKAGTRITIDQIKIVTPNNITLNGKGQLKAAANVPTGFVGQLKFDMVNLDVAAAAAQRQLLQPGGDRLAQTQTTMLLMALQGMSTKTATGYQILVDLTPQGQMLVNGQDVGGLIGKSGNAPSVPVMPVTSSPL